ncbi:histidine phosphatase family protein [Lysinibacter sp. HNR]|uniref:histidine phosphatase family protein n=1 Tax=Lysinibacter sp. HNR TaxID=3031408 RepID=UPI002434A87C|nr:histidine phosphatase family protein [Lysinibacter sp. HNR]WGD36635.1 histidine phosphatase family protein [Lysinibacter sp. HNR]
MTHPTTIALVRHGQTAWNAESRIQGRTDIPLNPVGRNQAQSAAETLTNDWQVVSSSPLSRAAETAAIIASELGLREPLLLEHLTERHFGEAEGLTASAELEKVRISRGFIGAEPEDVVALRGVQAIEHLRSTYPGQKIIAVSHGAFIRITLSSLFTFEAPRVSNLSISVIKHDGTDWLLESIEGIPARKLIKMDEPALRHSHRT